MAEQEVKSPSTEVQSPTMEAKSDDNERQSFDDSINTTPKPRARSPEATRSLTDHRPSSASSKEPTQTAGDEPPPPLPKASPVASSRNRVRDMAQAFGNGAADGAEKEKAKKHVPKKLSVEKLENLSEVKLGEDSAKAIKSPSATTTSNISPVDTTTAPPIPETEKRPESQSSRGVISPSLPSPEKPSLVPTLSDKATGMAGRFKSPFSWLSRAPTSGEKKVLGPTAVTPTERPTTSRSEIAMRFERSNSIESANFRNSSASLKDRFKAVRMREEAGITLPEEGTADAPGSPNSANQTESNSNGRRLSSSTVDSTINPSLPPGTAAGFAEGPRDSAPVDWDLWQNVVTEGPTAVARSSHEELSRAIAAGIPAVVRGVVWQVLANSKSDEMERFYHELVARGTEKERLANGNGETKDQSSIASSASSTKSGRTTPIGNGKVETLSTEADGFTNPQTPKPKSAKEELAHIQSLEKAIKRDLGARTAYSKYLMSSGLQDGLFGICKAYALYDEEVGYAQGMNFIAMPLLFNMREEEAFCMFVRIMSKYGMRNMFTHDMPGLHLHLYQFERLLEDFEPALYCHLNRRQVHPNLYATQWFLTLFAYRFPLQLVQRIYDLILSDNLELSILKFAIVLMQKNRAALLAMSDMSALCQFLKEKIFDVYIDRAPSSSSLLESGFFGSTGGVDKEVYRADELVQDAVAATVSLDMLKGYTAEWEEKTRTEKEREAELEKLRSTSTSLALKVRKLEQHVEKSDTEQVQMATELVRHKVDKEALMDANESLTGQVAELKSVVARQTEEVENRMRADMDEVMKRNLEVHNANRALEDDKAEMERELVEAKMQYAQINVEHEELKQRWKSVVTMMK